MGVARVRSSFGVNEWGKGTELVMGDTDMNTDGMISAVAIFRRGALIGRANIFGGVFPISELFRGLIFMGSR